MARRDDLIEALDAIETGMCRVKESLGIWQDDLVYALCQGVRLLLMEEVRKEKRPRLTEVNNTNEMPL